MEEGGRFRIVRGASRCVGLGVGLRYQCNPVSENSKSLDQVLSQAWSIELEGVVLNGRAVKHVAERQLIVGRGELKVAVGCLDC